MASLQILAPDGTSRDFPLDSTPVTLGRATSAQLSFPDDSGLSRQHLTIEPDPASGRWLIRDLGSKNGTIVNGEKLSGPFPLNSGDRISAGHLILVFDPPTASLPGPGLFFEAQETPLDNGATVFTNLQGLLKADTTAAAPGFADRQVAALIRAGNELSSHRPLPELFSFILDLAIQTAGADRGILVTVEDSGLEPRANRGEGFHISSLIRDRALAGESILIKDTSQDSAVGQRQSIVAQQVKTLMAVPLQTNNAVIGFIYVDSPSLVRQFTREDLNILTVMANVAAVRIEQTRFAELEQARKLLARDLEQAAEIQQQYLPSGAPHIPGLDLAGFNAPCRTVGGDYYDFFPYPEGRVGLILGDVSGKGMPASLLMMGLQARVQVMAEAPGDLADMMTRLNRITTAQCPPGRFITLFAAVLDSASGMLSYCNAGHNPPLLLSADGSYKELKGGGPVIGVLGDYQYVSVAQEMKPGDLLIIYSDGVTEAANSAGEDFDVPRLAEVAARNSRLPARQIVDAVVAAVNEFTVGVPQYDDITLMAVRRL